MVDALSEVSATKEVGSGLNYSNDVRKATDLMLIVTGSKINSYNAVWSHNLQPALLAATRALLFLLFMIYAFILHVIIIRNKNYQN